MALLINCPLDGAILVGICLDDVVQTTQLFAALFELIDIYTDSIIL